MTGSYERYDVETAAAWILGHARRTGIPALPEALAQKTSGECSAEELCAIAEAGAAADLKLYPFKRGTQTLQRSRRVLGCWKSASPS